MRTLKIILAILVICGISFFVAKSCIRRIPHPRPAIHRTLPLKQPLITIPQKTVEGVTPTVSHPKMAIILDDWGLNYSLTAQVVEIGEPITLSILPHLKYSKKIAETAHQNHLGVMLHMPMQPKNTKEHLEPHTILTTTSDKDILIYLDAAIAAVPYVEGVNNHMGSAATSDIRVMRTVLTHLKKKNLFFVDSFTIKDSQSPQVAKEIGIPFAKRDVFIDNEPNIPAIKKELQDAKAVALKKGRAVVIGHDKKVTLAAIKEMIPELKKAGIELVLAKDLVDVSHS